MIWFSSLSLEVPSTSFYFEGGLLSLVKFYNKSQKPIHDTVFYVDREVDDVGVEVALQYVDDITCRIVPFANNIYNPEGGTHVTGFKTALTRILNTYGKKNNMIKEADGGFTGDDVLEGLMAVISVKLREIQFEGQTKAKLGSTEAQGAVTTAFGEAFTTTTSGIVMPFLIQDIGFSLDTIAYVNKIIGIGSTLVGGLVAGFLLMRWSLYRALLVFGLLQALTNLLFVALAIVGNHVPTFVLAVMSDNFSAGLASTALVVLFMQMADRRFTATQFSILVVYKK